MPIRLLLTSSNSNSQVCYLSKLNFLTSGAYTASTMSYTSGISLQLKMEAWCLVRILATSINSKFPSLLSVPLLVKHLASNGTPYMLCILWELCVLLELKQKKVCCKTWVYSLKQQLSECLNRSKNNLLGVGIKIGQDTEIT